MAGFIYVWRDKRDRRYYIGSHWGSIDDGYVCSSKQMLAEYRLRPYDFLRKIVETVEDRSLLIAIENRWLAMIKPEELSQKYYNVVRMTGHWQADEETRNIVKAKISAGNKGKKRSSETRLHLSKIRRENPFYSEHMTKLNVERRGKKLSEEHRSKISSGSKHQKQTEEVKLRISEAKKKWWADGGKPRPQSEETRAKISEARKKYWTSKKETVDYV